MERKYRIILLLLIFIIVFLPAITIFTGVTISPTGTYEFGPIKITTDGPEEIIYITLAVIGGCVSIIGMIVEIVLKIKNG